MCDDGWGPWIEHDGKHDNPAGRGQWINCIWADKSEYIGPSLQKPIWGDSRPKGFLIGDRSYSGPFVSDSWLWGGFGRMVPVIRYRLKKNPSIELMKLSAKSLDCVTPRNLEDAE